MYIKYARVVLCLVGTFVATVGVATNATAQELQQEQLLLTEMIVTATRRQEVQNQIPIAVTAISADRLEEAGIEDIQDLQGEVPNLIIQSSFGGDSAATVNIRGLVQSNSDSTLDTAVGVYQDDVFLARTYSVLGQLLDVERVEILRGPQGTLFGRNTIGGAIQIVSVKPELEGDADAYIKLGAGNFGLGEVSAASTFELSDTLAVRVAGSASKRDGYTSSLLVDDTFNPAAGQFGYIDGVSPILDDIDTDDRDNRAYRASLLWQPSYATRVDVSYYHSENQTNGTLQRGRTGDLGAPNLAVGDLETTGRGFSVLTDSDFYAGLTSIRPEGDDEVDIAIATLEQQLGDNLALKVIASYAQADNDEVANTDGIVQSLVGAVPSPATLLIHSIRDQEVDQTTLEVQLSGSSSNEKFNWIAGLYYFDEESIDRRSEVLRSPFFETTPASQLPPQLVGLAGGFPSTFVDVVANNDSKSVYGNLNWLYNDSLTFRFGGRYTEDTKGYLGASTRAGGPIPAGIDLCIFNDLPTFLANCSLRSDADFENFTWEVSADYKFSDATFAYAKVGTGYRTGGISLNANSAATAAPFDEDNVTSYELGLKTEVGANARLNAALFYVDYTDVQQNTVSSAANSCAQTRPQEQVIITCNFGDAESVGFELDGLWQVNDSFGLSASLGYVDFTFESPDTIPTGTPEYTFNVSGIYTSEIAGMPLRAVLSYQKADDYFATSDALIDEAIRTIESYSVLNGRISLQVSDNLNVSLWGKNLNEDEYTANATTSRVAFALANTGYAGAPRTFGVDVQYDF